MNNKLKVKVIEGADTEMFESMVNEFLSEVDCKNVTVTTKHKDNGDPNFMAIIIYQKLENKHSMYNNL